MLMELLFHPQNFPDNYLVIITHPRRFPNHDRHIILTLSPFELSPLHLRNINKLLFISTRDVYLKE